MSNDETDRRLVFTYRKELWIGLVALPVMVAIVILILFVGLNGLQSEEDRTGGFWAILIIFGPTILVPIALIFRGAIRSATIKGDELLFKGVFGSSCVQLDELEALRWNVVVNVGSATLVQNERKLTVPLFGMTDTDIKTLVKHLRISVPEELQHNWPLFLYLFCQSHYGAESTRESITKAVAAPGRMVFYVLAPMAVLLKVALLNGLLPTSILGILTIVVIAVLAAVYYQLAVKGRAEKISLANAYVQSHGQDLPF